MKHAFLGAALLVAAIGVSAVPSMGQDVSERRVRDAVSDATRGVGQSIAGGSALVGAAAPLGGPGRIRVGAALGTTRIEVLDPSAPVGEIDFHAPMAALNVGVGLWDGPGFGAIDVIGRAGLVSVGDDFENGVPLFAIGGRLGLIEETVVTPAVSASVYRSWLPDLGFADLDAEEIAFEADVGVLSARVDVSKGFVVLTPYAGVGLDRTSIDARYRIPASRSTGDQEVNGSIDTSSTHAKAYVGAEIGPAPLGLSVEIGRYGAGWFGFLGLRLGTS